MTDTPNRSKDEVIGLILEAARKGSSKTNIMYKSFVSYDKVEELLNHLLEDNLLEQQKGELTYRTTEQGVDFLNKLNRCDSDENESIEKISEINNNFVDTALGTALSPTSNLSLVHFNKILVIGLGQLGLPVAKYVKDRGFDVYGYDISTKALERAEKTAGIKKAINFSGFDVYIICVSTHRQEDMFSPQIEGILSIVQDKIAKEAKNGALVSIESTIPKGTSKKVFEMLNHRLHVAHAPHRWYALEEKEHGVNQLRVVGGVCDCCLRAAMQFYDGAVISTIEEQREATTPKSASIETTEITTSGNGNGNGNGHGLNNFTNIPSIKNTSLGIPMHPVPEIEIAELTKIIENAHRYLQIAFAEDLYLYCQANNINFAELRDSVNTKWNVNVLEPREGIGGHCLPKDTKMFLNSSRSIKSKILEAAIEVDSEYRRKRGLAEQTNSPDTLQEEIQQSS
jgi:UDP-N-acetyl-D-mannosaminuronic acid dehydrogenase